MSDLITTLKKKDDISVNVYPNIKGDNIPDNSISASKIINGNVTLAKLASNARPRYLHNINIDTSTFVDGAENDELHFNFQILSTNSTPIEDGASLDEVIYLLRDSIGFTADDDDVTLFLIFSGNDIDENNDAIPILNLYVTFSGNSYTLKAQVRTSLKTITITPSDIASLVDIVMRY